MAINKTISANGSRGHHTYTLYVEETKTEGNDSYLSGSFTLSPIQTGWDWANWGDRISYSVSVGQYQFTGTIPTYNGSSVLYLQSFSNLKVTHKSDGTKTIDISFSVDDNANQTYTSGDASASSTLTLSQLHKKPVINSVSVTEQNTSLKVENTTLVNLLSKKLFTITSLNLYDNATLKKIEIYGENFNFSFTSFSNNAVSCDFKKFNINSTSSTINATIKITDSLGSTATKSVTLNYVNYQYPTIIETQSNVKRNGQLTGKAKLNLLGTFANLKVGSTTNIPSLKYRYYEYGTTPSETLTYTTIPTDAYSIDNNSISIYNWGISKDNVEITDLAKNKSYAFEIILSDSFSDITNGVSASVILICSKGEWLMAKFKDRVDFKKITRNGVEVSDSSFCKMTTSSDYTAYTSDSYEQVKGWTNPINNGDYSCDITNNRLIIKNTSIIEIGGWISGNDYAAAQLRIYNLTTNEEITYSCPNWTVIQFAGNGFWSTTLPHMIQELDNTQTYYVILLVQPYNTDDFSLNDGFTKKGTFIYAKKIL